MHSNILEIALRAYITRFLFLYCYCSLNSLCTQCFRLNISLPLSLKTFEYISYLFTATTYNVMPVIENLNQKLLLYDTYAHMQCFRLNVSLTLSLKLSYHLP